MCNYGCNGCSRNHIRQSPPIPPTPRKKKVDDNEPTVFFYWIGIPTLVSIISLIAWA